MSYSQFSGFGSPPAPHRDAERPRRRHAFYAASVLAVIGLAALLVASRLMSRESGVEHALHSPRNVDPNTSCGPVALAVVARVLDRPGTIANFHASTGSGNLGVCSLDDLERAIEAHGLSGAAIRLDPRRPPRHRLPMVLFVDGNHFVTAVPAVDPKHVVILDPPSEPQLAPWSDLYPRWRGEALLVGHSAAELEIALSEE